jgi:hypothetical protein
MRASSFLDRYASVWQRALDKFAEEFGYELSDPFDELCAMLAEERPFSFSRFGDGEFNAIFGEDGANCDGHRYFPDLGRRLREILEREPDYVMGLQIPVIIARGAKSIHATSGAVRWVLGGGIHLASMEGRLGVLFDSLACREVLLVGASHHRRLAEEKEWQFVEIANKDCWLQYESLRNALEWLAAHDGVVFLFCASMTANVLIDDLHRRNPRNTYIDIGSVLDPYGGVKSRNYHKELALDPLTGLLKLKGGRGRLSH